jgi:hypothetical protein
MKLPQLKNGWLSWNLLPVTFLAVFAISAPACAGMLSTDIHAMQRGSVPFYDDYQAPAIFDGTLDYAVYSPGSSFNDTFGAGADPSNGTRYVYAYQIISTSSTDPIKLMTVGLAAGASPADPGYVASSSGTSPNGGSNPSSLIGSGTPPVYNSSSWKFLVTKIEPGQSSKVLYFTSPYGPEMDSVSLQGAAISAWTGSVPSPVPEPASIFYLLACGGVFLVYRVLRRK